MTPAKKRSRILAVVCVVFFYFFYTSFGTSKRKHNVLLPKKVLLKRELEKHSNWREDGLNFQSNRVVNWPLSSLKEQLSHEFPYERSKPFQKNIWQTWKVAVTDETFPQKYKTFQKTWETKNPGYKHYVIADQQCDSMVNQLYENVPDVAEAWNAMPKSILKADFFRYLILFARGGVYSDIDTQGLKPIDTWVSNNKTLYGKLNQAGLVVGIEADPDRPDWAEWYARRIQFCQWTIQAKKGHPMLRDLIARITELTLERKKNGNLKKTLGKDEGGDIMNWTGPGIFTDLVFEYMNNIVQPLENFYKDKLEEIVTWELFTGIRVPLALEDVLVLPITSFSPAVGQMGAGPTTDKWAYAQHLFLGSWKHDEPRKRQTLGGRKHRN